jgi:excisionase family DNA binding protein
MSRLLTTREVADHFRISPDTVRRRIESGELKAINIGSRNRPTYRIPEDSLGSMVLNAVSKMPDGIEEII